MANIIVEEKIENIALESAKNLNGNKILEDEIKSKIRLIINEEEIKTNNEEINDLASTISKKLGIENNSQTKIEAKKIWIELDKWKNEKVREVEDFKKEEFKNKFTEETKKLNPDLKEEQLESVKKYAEEIGEIYSKNNEIDGCKNEILETNSQFSPGQLQNSFTDLKGIVQFLKKSPSEIKEKIETVKSIKEKLKDVKLPNLKELRSFENIAAIFGKDGSNYLFSKTQKYLGWADKITGGWLSKTAVDVGRKLVTKIGNQAVREFASNSLGVLAKEGFQKGFQTVLKGIMSGGVKAAGTGAATGAAAGATAIAGGAAATGVGIPVAVIILAGEAVLFLKNKLSKIAEKLGIGLKGFLEENFGKVGGKIIGGLGSVLALPMILLGSISMVIMGPILIAVFGGMFIYQMFQGSLVSSLVPPKDQYSIEKTDYNSEDSVVLFGNYSGTVGTYVNPKNGITLYVFEKESEGGRMTQRYDLDTADSSYLEKINGGYLDKRVDIAYEAMIEKARKEGISYPELSLISGYRDSATQKQLWDEALVKYGNAETAGIWASNPAKGLSAHASGRTVDIVVCGGSAACGGVENQKKSKTFQWLKNNAADFGFYNYAVEPWHWEYNPVDLTLKGTTSL